jgi:two-component system sensor histidine kinase/response regulator
MGAAVLQHLRHRQNRGIDHGILGIAQLLETTNLDSRQRTYAHTIRQSGEALLTILNDILDFSKIEAGKMSIETIDFFLCEVVEDVAALLAGKAVEKGIHLCCVLPPLSGALHAAERLQGDPGRLRQILLNLLGNAIKFTDAGGEVVIGGEILAETPQEARWRLYVRDTGIGIAPEKQALVFESFTQADGSTTRNYGGTGIGLTICRQLATLMEGQIGLHSQVGQGSEFYVEIPFPKQDTPAQAQIEFAMPTTDRRTLIIAPNRTQRDLLTGHISAWGGAVCTAGDLASAPHDSDECDLNIALLIVDASLLEGNRAAWQQLAERAWRTQTPITLLVSRETPGVTEALKRGEAMGAIRLPIRQQELYDAWSQVVHGVQGEAQAGLPETSLPSAGVASSALNRYRAGEQRILLAEDNAVNQMVMVQFLGLYGIAESDVTVVENGQEALAELDLRPYDLVFMDVQMPVMDGVEATRRLREREQQAGTTPIPIIALTARTMAGDREQLLEAGMSDYLAKPVDASLLPALLARWLPDAAPAAVPVEERAAAPTDEGVDFDWSKLAALCRGNCEFEQKLLREFLKSAPKMLQRCRIAVEMDDSEMLNHWAHTLKGSCRTLGATALGNLCQQMEMAGKENRAAEAETELVRAEQAWERAQQQVQERLSELPLAA